LLAVQTAISLEDNRARIGRTYEVLVEGPSKAAVKGDSGATGAIRQLTGRTPCDRIVVFDGPERLVGQLIPVVVEDASAVTLFGQVATTGSTPGPAAGMVTRPA
jgi:tRNA-2-methylthio-N6-dimethylallyladenosine synthase